MKIFLSAVSAQFKACRDALRSDLRAVGAEVVVQEDFTQGGGSLLQKLETYIASCDRVLALVGDVYGWEPAETIQPVDRPRRSYTQWEYAFAQGERLDGSRKHACPTYLYFAAPDFLAQHTVTQAPDVGERQRAFAVELRRSGKDYNVFSSLHELRAIVLRDGFQLAERAPQARNLPFASLGGLFKGRRAVLEDLHDRFQRAPERAVVVHGLGGVGKSRLALEYALTHEAEYTALLVVTGDTPTSLQHTLAALCVPSILSLDEQQAKEEEVRVAAVLRWLHTHPGWLLIVDNVDDAVAAGAVERLLGTLHGGHVLVAARWSGWSGSVDTLDLDVLPPDAATAFLLERTAAHRRVAPTDADDAGNLAKEVAGLPLALEQAAAFVVRRRVSLGDYLRRWQEGEQKVRAWHDPTMHYPRSVAATWNTTFDQLSRTAQALLRVLCWFASEPVPRDLLATAQATEALAELLAGEGATSPDVEDGLAELGDFSLVTWVSDREAFRVHRLISEVTRDRLPVDQRHAWIHAAVAVVAAYLPADAPPSDVRSWSRWEPVRAHVATVVVAADGAGVTAPISGLMDEFGVLLQSKGLWIEAEPLLRRALAIDEAIDGADHLNVAIRLNNLAALLHETNRLAEAEPLMRRVCEIFEKSLGGEHPKVATALNNLAQLLEETNRLAEAEPLLRRALTITESSYGPDHPNVAIPLNNLAQLLQATNRLGDAEPLMKRALAIDQASCGPNHPNVARDLNNLGSLLQATNRLAEAEPLLRRALAIDEASYGADHPEVAGGLSNLASLLQATNRLAEAEPLLRRALAIDEASYGPKHPNVALRLNNLASLLRHTNRLAEAEPLLRRALAIDEASYGTDHPQVASVLSNLASVLQATNRRAEAEPLLRRALAIDETSYGPDHPGVARDLNNLAALLHETNRLAEAEPLMRRVCEIFEKSLGREHPNLATALNNLAQLLEETSRLAEAEPLRRQALTIDESSYGPDHPNVAVRLNNLASLLQDTNRLAEAEPLLRRALAIDEAGYGPDHPNVALRLNNLASLLEARNRWVEAALLRLRADAIEGPPLFRQRWRPSTRA